MGIFDLGVRLFPIWQSWRNKRWDGREVESAKRGPDPASTLPVRAPSTVGTEQGHGRRPEKLF